MDQGWYVYRASADNMTTLADAGDFFQVLGGSRAWKVLEVRVWQRGSTSLVLDTIGLRRAAIVGPSGTAVTEHSDLVSNAPTPTCSALSLPTVDVSTPTWEYRIGWNSLQELHWLPIPTAQLPIEPNDDFGIHKESSVAHTGVGCSVTWAEYVGG